MPFTGGADGGSPYAGLIADPAGNLYGTTYKGGASGAGVVYKVAPSGGETVLYSFTGGADGGNPYAGVISDPEGNLYGTTVYGGTNFDANGVIYKLSPTRQETVLYSFNGACCGPSAPYAGVTRDSAGNLYGTTSARYGSVYELDASGQFTVLHNFGPNGPNVPSGGVIRDTAGNFFGTTDHGGTAGLGAAYRIDAAGHLTVLYNFDGGPAGERYAGLPNAGVIRDPQGNVYGTTPYGGVEGMVYKVDSGGQQTTLYSFSGAPGGTTPVAGVAVDPAGGLCGATQLGGAYDWGVVYRIGGAGHEAALYSFTGGSDGAFPESTPVIDEQGNVYGTTLKGGPASGLAGFGVVYKIDLAGHETVLHTFTGGADGGYPGGLTRDSAGNLYGAAGGGTLGGGVVYRIGSSGVQAILYSFSGGADGASPGDVILDANGNIYGTTYGGGTAGYGVVYKLDYSRKETVLYNFPGGPDGALGGAKLLRDPAGNLFGTTLEGGGASYEEGGGVVFELDSAGSYTVLYRFTGYADGGLPRSGVIRDSSGNLYGTASTGGDSGMRWVRRGL
jgi:uncharacterized repeat protein (TIGR03803 family)